MTLVYLSDVDGVRLGGHTAERLDAEEARPGMDDGTIAGGMALKVRVALEAAAAGIPEVVIAGKARLLGQLPRHTHRRAGGERGETVTTALLPIYERDLVLVKGKGSRLWDKDGREWLDFAAGIAVNGFGYGDKKIVAAVKKQAERLMHTSNLFHTEPASALAERLVRLAFPSKVFFTNSGTEAFEGAMKFARRIGKEQGRTEYVAFENAFHGRTMGALSLDLDREVPRALRAARARRALRPARRPRRAWRPRSARRPPP